MRRFVRGKFPRLCGATARSGGIPAITLAELESSSPAVQRACALKLREAVITVGFFTVHGGLPHHLVGEAFGAAKRFFALPDAEKDAIHIRKSPHFRGYSETGAEYTAGARDHKETLDMGLEGASALPLQPGEPPYRCLQGPNQWPARDPAFQATAQAYMAANLRLGRRIMSRLADALDLPSDAFERYFVTPTPCCA